MISPQEVERKLAEINRLTAELQQAMHAPTPAAPKPVAAPAAPKKRKHAPQRTRAYFYLRVMPSGLDNADVIYRVLGTNGLIEANRLEAQARAGNTPLRVERLNSRQYATLVEGRRQAIKHGAANGFMGALEAVPLTGPESIRHSE